MDRQPARLLRSTTVALLSGLLATSALLASCGSHPASLKKTAAALLREGVRLENRGENAAARHNFAAVLATKHALTNGYGAVAYYNLGLLDQKERHSALAVQEYNRAIALAPNYSAALFNLAIIEAASKPAAAISLYQRVLKIQPNNASAMFNLGLTYFAIGRIADAKVWLRKAIHLDPTLVTRLPSNITL